MAPYASKTKVEVDQTEQQIKKMLRAAGATSTSFSEGPGMAMVMFDMEERRITFKLPLPSIEAAEFNKPVKANQFGTTRPPSPASVEKAWEQACRARWRALHLCIKAKIESINAGVETFEDAFLAHVVMPDGKTVGEHAREGIAIAYQTGKMQPLLPPPR